MNLEISEIFYSIQGESSYAGLPFTFIRLSGCNLRCSYCDTKYSYEKGDELTIDAILDRVGGYPLKNVEITGGEPLLQEGCTLLIDRLVEHGYNVLIETNGSQDISKVNPKATKIVDIKCPGSGEAGSFDAGNIDHLTTSDEVKFVVTSREDYIFAKEMIVQHDLTKRCNLIISVASNLIPLEILAQWILDDGLDVRMQLQLHKYIFGDKRGV